MKMSDEMYNNLKAVIKLHIDKEFTESKAVSILAALSGRKLKSVKKDF